LSEHEEEKPPILGRWFNLYAVVLAWLAAQIAIYYALTRWLQ
jgi:hypothetical protein